MGIAAGVLGRNGRAGFNPRFVCACAEREGLRHFERDAVAVIVAHGSRMVDDQEKLSARFGRLRDRSDKSVGTVLDAIRDAKLSDRTLVIFTSDNGPWLTYNEQGGSAGPLRDGKGSTWEGGMREPTIAWWPSYRSNLAQKALCRTCKAI